MKTILPFLFLFASLTAMAQSTDTDSTTISASTEQMTDAGFHNAVMRFGYLSYSRVLHSMPQYVQAQKSLKELRATYDRELSRSEDAFNRQFEEYIDGQKAFPENILLKRQKELQQLMEQGIAFKQEAERLISSAETEMMEPLNRQLSKMLNEIGFEHGFAYILNTDNNTYPFINPELGVDITDEVLRRIK